MHMGRVAGSWTLDQRRFPDFCAKHWFDGGMETSNDTAPGADAAAPAPRPSRVRANLSHRQVKELLEEKLPEVENPVLLEEGGDSSVAAFVCMHACIEDRPAGRGLESPETHPHPASTRTPKSLEYQGAFEVGW
jgi:hypothetical protein